MKGVISVPVIAVACFLAACGTQPGGGTTSGHGSPSPSPTGVLSVGTVGFGGDEPAPGAHYSGNATAGVVLTNESRTLAAKGIELQWIIYNSSGQVIDTDSSNIAVVRSSQSFAIVTQLSSLNTTDIESVKVQSHVQYWSVDTKPNDVITGQNVNIIPGSSTGSWKVSGELKNGYTSDLESVPTYIYCMDGSGKFVAGGYTLATLLPASGTGAVSVSVYTRAAPASCEINAVPATIPLG